MAIRRTAPNLRTCKDASEFNKLAQRYKTCDDVTQNTSPSPIDEQWRPINLDVEKSRVIYLSDVRRIIERAVP
ncbi:hypothetical protein FRC02_002054 [Tulasnella sp. 418]|nr:hypothetical protein FRC02_002054 [Tulasnella sp. 418]